MKTILLSTAALLLSTSMSFAGSYEAPAPLPPIPAPDAANDWGGFYVGGMGSTNSGTFSFFNAGTPAGTYPLADTSGYGAFVGYNIQRGALVYGVELAYTSLTAPTGRRVALNQDYFADAKLRFGYSFGKAMVYAVGGYSMGNAIAKGNDIGQTGYVYGGGIDVMLSDNMFMGFEVTERVIKGEWVRDYFIESKIQTMALRVGWNF